MLKIRIMVFFWFAFCFVALRAQVGGVGTIAISVVLPDYDDVPADAGRVLEAKLQQVVTAYGVVGDGYSERFVLTAKINVVSKDIVPSTPPRISQKLEVVFMIGDVVANKLYETASLNVSGIGTNETKAFAAAFNTINVKHKQLATLVENAKSKIVAYYNANCDQMLADAQLLAANRQYDEAIYKLTQVPTICQDCYTKSIHLAEKLLAEASAKLEADEKREWDFKMQQYNEEKEREQRDFQFTERQQADSKELSTKRIEALQSIGTAWAKNQPKEINNLKIIRTW
ncbi:hypothetical protein SAMD00024442_282_1 [Candidatus Symbiothrix dinenymphae]|nr:hypothetical protein SAMD00024442_282_1 [Candidatus Symbiothrix dinenymphae]